MCSKHEYLRPTSPLAAPVQSDVERSIRKRHGNLSRFITSDYHDGSHGSANSKCGLGPAKATGANIGNTGRQLSYNIRCIES